MEWPFKLSNMSIELDILNGKLTLGSILSFKGRNTLLTNPLLGLDCLLLEEWPFKLSNMSIELDILNGKLTFGSILSFKSRNTLLTNPLLGLDCLPLECHLIRQLCTPITNIINLGVSRFFQYQLLIHYQHKEAK